NADGPLSAAAIRNGLVLRRERGAATEHPGTAVPDAQAVTIGRLLVASRERRGRARDIRFGERHGPHDVAGHGRIVEVGDRAPGIVCFHPQGETSIHPDRVDAYRAEMVSARSARSLSATLAES